tara:strand:- start:1171 stop:2094 length:924 start_codon:yes stop_codon:yes gene_type:complete
MKNKVSIIIPIYNRVHLISETLKSIRDQTYTNWECIIVDDHSTDGTFELLSELARKDSKIRVYLKPDHLPKGPSASRNYGLSLAEGEFINWFDSDDLMHPQKLAKDLVALEDETIDFTISQSEFFGKNKPKKKYWNQKLFSNQPIDDFILKKIGWSTNAPLWRKKSLSNKKLQFCESLITADDYLFHIEALNNNLTPSVINETLVYQREHDNRLNEYKGKSKFKCYVYAYIFDNVKVIRTETINTIENKMLQQIKALYRNRNFKLARRYSNFLSKKTEKHSLVLTLFGLKLKTLIYQFTGKGYSFFK